VERGGWSVKKRGHAMTGDFNPSPPSIALVHPSAAATGPHPRRASSPPARQLTRLSDTSCPRSSARSHPNEFTRPSFLPSLGHPSSRRGDASLLRKKEIPPVAKANEILAFKPILRVHAVSKIKAEGGGIYKI